jgi:cell wall-associated NlpC family hydrolase
MDNAAQRAAVVTEARSWLGTPYHPGADIKSVGCDCGMLPTRVFCDLGLVEPFDPRPYPASWHLHRSEERYLGYIIARTRELDRVEDAGPGDILMFRQGRCFSHGAIVTGDPRQPLTTGWPWIVHAFAQNGHVEEANYLNSPLAWEGCTPRPIRAFSIWGR